jgi:hypothetical protein
MTPHTEYGMGMGMGMGTPEAAPRTGEYTGFNPYAQRPGVPTPQPVAPTPDAAAATTTVQSNEVSVITMKCRAVDLTSIASEANSTIAYTLQEQLKASTNFFIPEKTELVGQLVPDPTTGTFTFDVSVSLKNPLKP